MNKYVIETKQLTKTYGEQTVVNSVNIHVKQGQIYGLLGRNGAGKTTIMKMILGLTDITSGEVDVFGQNIKGREKRVYPGLVLLLKHRLLSEFNRYGKLGDICKTARYCCAKCSKKRLEIVGLPYRDKNCLASILLE